MTRFARAKGSKSSNEKAPEDSTPWEVMKEQLMQTKNDKNDSKKRQEAEDQRKQNYENFLNERKTQKRKAVWCDFPEVSSKLENNSDPLKTINKKTKKVHTDSTIETNNNDSNIDATNSHGDKKSKKKKKKEKIQNSNIPIDHLIGNDNKKKKRKNKGDNVEEVTNANDIAMEDVIENDDKGKKRKKKSDNVEKVTKSNDTQKESKEEKKIKKKNKKNIDGKPARKKPINDRGFQLAINGKEVELVRFDGFPIMKKDAERLTELKESMIKKGIPKSEVQRTIKLERRRAEKALARLKRDVCYNCRKGGHNLSDCPDLKKPGMEMAEGICFKCGSTEHKQFECKVQRDKEFRFATCFICRQPGHLARQCPDNPKGLYPNGGSCKLCGDVTHLRKDCPTVNTVTESSKTKLQTLDVNNDLEGIGGATDVIVNKETSSKKPKKIKF